MIRVGIVGFGTIGRRVADAIELQKDMELVGVVKNSPDYGVTLARERGYPLFCTKPERFEGHDVEGSIEDLIDESDIIVDSAPGGIGRRNKETYYEPAGKPAIFQGAEKADIGVSFNANANYDAAIDARYVRVVSCNTTGLSRLLHLVKENFEIDLCNATLIRRAADPKEDGRGPVDAIKPKSGVSHHAPDVQTVMDVNLYTTAYKVPTTLMHVHDVYFKTAKPAYGLEDLLEEEPRILVANPDEGFTSTAKVMDFARDLRLRSDIYENVVFSGFTVEKNHVYMTQAIQQESIVVPENIDAIRAMMGVPRDESVPETNRTLAIGQFRLHH